MAAALARSPPAPPVTPPELILYEHVSRRGQELVLTDSVPELETGWDDALSSLEVNGGTWRLYELPHFDPAGWYVDVGGRGLVHEASESGGWTNDAVSSIELLSLENERPGWAVLDRGRPSRAGGE
jgi:hypothetical protein